MLNPPRRHSRTRNRCTAKASARTNQQQTAAGAKAITVTDCTVFKHLMERNPKILKRIFELTFNISIADLKQLNAEEFLPVWPDSDGCVPGMLVRDNQNRHYYVEMCNRPLPGGTRTLMNLSIVYCACIRTHLCEMGV